MSRLGVNIRLGMSGGYSGEPSTPATPSFTMINDANTTVTNQGTNDYLLTKSGGTDNTWGDAAAHSSTALTGDFILRFIPQNNANFMVGVNSDPATDNNYTGLDHAIFIQAALRASRWQNGVEVVELRAVFTLGETFFIKRASGVLTFGYGGTDGVTGFTSVSTVADASTLYFDSSFNSAGASVAVKRIA